MTFAGVGHAPDGSGTKLALVVACHIGAPERAEEELRPLREFGSPAMVELGPLPYTVLNSLLDGGYPTGSLNYWKSGFLGALSDAAIDELLERFAVCPSPMTAALLEHFHGEVTQSAGRRDRRAPPRAGLTTSRSRRSGPTRARPTTTSPGRRRPSPRWSPSWPVGATLNYFSEDDVGDDPVRAAYGSNYDRLVELKAKYDPTNLFHLNANIPPGQEPLSK